MGCLKPCFSTSGASVEVAVVELYDEAAARTTLPGFDDVLGEPFLEDGDDDGVGERVRPGTVYRLKAKVQFSRYEEQQQDQLGNAPAGLVLVTLYDADLAAQGLLANGVCRVRANDRLLRIELNDGSIREDLEAGQRPGYFCVEVRPGETGTRTRTAVFEPRRQAATA